MKSVELRLAPGQLFWSSFVSARLRSCNVLTLLTENAQENSGDKEKKNGRGRCLYSTYFLEESCGKSFGAGSRRKRCRFLVELSQEDVVPIKQFRPQRLVD